MQTENIQVLPEQTAVNVYPDRCLKSVEGMMYKKNFRMSASRMMEMDRILASDPVLADQARKAAIHCLTRWGLATILDRNSHSLHGE